MNWRFDERSFARQVDPDGMTRKVRRLLEEGIASWGDAAPVAFTESHKDWDFELALRARKDCDGSGCTLASAFFPGTQREKILLYPTLFEQDRDEQVTTLAHELGHVFGLRHFFVDMDAEEKKLPSVVFGKHSRFSIMNYGSDGRLTESDRADLKRVYQAAWSADAQSMIGKQVRLLDRPGRSHQKEST